MEWAINNTGKLYKERRNRTAAWDILTVDMACTNRWSN